ncbi:hypothetical protein [Paenibacillus illinoisensis]|uniref:hypothetical protein n=1 Tax=Paenibacillus illinoisensis TaxID=59845 RepID=UPI003016B8F4
MRKFFGVCFILFAIMMPFITSSANVPTEMIFGPIIFTFIILFVGIKLVRKKKSKPQRKFYGGDYRSHLDSEDAQRNVYSSYSSNTVSYTSNNSYTSHNTYNFNNMDLSDIGYAREANNREEDEELQGPVSVNCPGCGAKAKVYPKQSTDCEYCGTTLRAS